MVDEMVLIANQVYNENLCLDDIDATVLNKQRINTSKRELHELLLRLKRLSDDELEVLATTSLVNQRLLCFISCIRAYLFLREFMEEVVLENHLLLKPTIDELDYTVFFNRKSLEYSEVDGLATSTKEKVRQVIFKMLEQAGLIDNVSSRRLQVPYIDISLGHLISPEERKYLLN